MKLTSNYNLKKPDGSDVVNINDFNDNVDKIDDEIKKVNVKADDMSFTTASNRVNIESGDTRKVVLGKIAKWFGELKGLAFKDKVAVGDLDSNVIAHDLTTTHVSKVLGADQGGVLLGKIGELNDNLMPLLKNVRGYENFTQKVSDMIIGNNFISTSCVISVDTPEYAPAQESSVWYNVLTVGIGNRCYQTAVQCFEQRPSTGVMYIRTQHDESVSNWRQINNDFTIKNIDFIFNTDVATLGSISAKCAGNIVTITGWFETRKPLTSTVTVLTLKEPKYAPSYNINTLCNVNVNETTYFDVDAGGQLVFPLLGYPTQTTIRFAVTYAI